MNRKHVAGFNIVVYSWEMKKEREENKNNNNSYVQQLQRTNAQGNIKVDFLELNGRDWDRTGVLPIAKPALYHVATKASLMAR